MGKSVTTRASQQERDNKSEERVQYGLIAEDVEIETRVPT